MKWVWKSKEKDGSDYGRSLERIVLCSRSFSFSHLGSLGKLLLFVLTHCISVTSSYFWITTPSISYLFLPLLAVFKDNNKSISRERLLAKMSDLENQLAPLAPSPARVLLRYIITNYRDKEVKPAMRYAAMSERTYDLQFHWRDWPAHLLAYWCWSC